VRGPSLDDLLALLWGACGLGVAVYFVVLGREDLDMGVSGTIMFALAGVVLVGFSIVALRHAQRGREARAERNSGPLGGWGAGPQRRPVPTPGPVPGRPPAEQDPQHRVDRPPPELSPSGRAALAHVVAVAERAGLFAPRTPRAADLMEGVADHGEPVTLDAVLAAIAEIDLRHPGLRPEDHLAALAFHDSHVEQFADTLTEQVADLDRLAGDDRHVRLLDVRRSEPDDTGAVPTRLRVAVGRGGEPGDEQTLDYRGDDKYLSTVLHVAVARALHTLDPGAARLAWTWSDQGVWLAALRPAALEALNRELGRALLEPWRWVDEEEPVAAGDLRRRR
jgi:hypothetical protein